jgi:hypothetical protein
MKNFFVRQETIHQSPPKDQDLWGNVGHLHLGFDYISTWSSLEECGIPKLTCISLRPMAFPPSHDYLSRTSVYMATFYSLISLPCNFSLVCQDEHL